MINRVACRYCLRKVALMVIACVFIHSQAHATEVSETSLKAVYLFRVGSYASWPQEVDVKNKGLCILGENPFGGTLEYLATKKKTSTSYTVYYPRNYAKLDRCHVVYISQSEETTISSIITTLRGKPILSVSDIQGFAAAGGMIGIKKVESNLRLQINLASVCSATIRMTG